MNHLSLRSFLTRLVVICFVLFLLNRLITADFHIWFSCVSRCYLVVFELYYTRNCCSAVFIFPPKSLLILLICCLQVQWRSAIVLICGSAEFRPIWYTHIGPWKLLSFHKEGYKANVLFYLNVRSVYVSLLIVMVDFTV